MPLSTEDQVTIEKTPSYFISKNVPKRIKKMNKDTKIILVVRDPVTRAISDYAQAKIKRPTLLAFEEMVKLGKWVTREEKKELDKKDKELQGSKTTTTSAKEHHTTKAIHGNKVQPHNSQNSLKENWGPIKIGLYARHLERWLEHFPLKQIHFVHGEKFILDPSGELALLQNFLKLPHFIGDHFFVHDPVKGFPCLRMPLNDSNDWNFSDLNLCTKQKCDIKTKDSQDGYVINSYGIVKTGDINGSKSLNSSTFNTTQQETTELKTKCLGETKGRKHPHVKTETIEKLRAFYRPHNQNFYQLSKINFGWP